MGPAGYPFYLLVADSRDGHKEAEVTHQRAEGTLVLCHGEMFAWFRLMIARWHHTSTLRSNMTNKCGIEMFMGVANAAEELEQLLPRAIQGSY